MLTGKFTDSVADSWTRSLTSQGGCGNGGVGAVGGDVAGGGGFEGEGVSMM